MAEPWDSLMRAAQGLLGRNARPPPGQAGIEVTENNIPQYLQGLSALAQREVLVGIPEGAADRPEGGINNATLGYIHEHGSPANNIPARPWLRPGVLESQSKWQPRLARAGGYALTGDKANMEKSFAEAGQIAASAVQLRIRAGIDPPLKQSTINRRRRRTPGKAYRRKATSAADVVPLIDTANFIRAITYVVMKRRK